MSKTPYLLDDQIGYVLRRVQQRHLALFADAFGQLTTTQFAALSRLSQMGPMSQNLLGRETAMDAATIKGVVDRLARQGLVQTAPDPNDKRRLTVSLTDEGAALYAAKTDTGLEVSGRTVAPLTTAETQELLRLLRKLT